MKCTTCGTLRTKVLSTRSWLEGAMLKRRRECANGHRFTTIEVIETKAVEKYSAATAKGVNKRGDIYNRHTAVIAQVRSGKKLADVAAALNIAESTVSWILKKRAPELTLAGGRKRCKITTDKDRKCKTK